MSWIIKGCLVILTVLSAGSSFSVTLFTDNVQKMCQLYLFTTCGQLQLWLRQMSSCRQTLSIETTLLLLYLQCWIPPWRLFIQHKAERQGIPLSFDASHGVIFILYLDLPLTKRWLFVRSASICTFVFTSPVITDHICFTMCDAWATTCLSYVLRYYQIIDSCHRQLSRDRYLIFEMRPGLTNQLISSHGLIYRGMWALLFVDAVLCLSLRGLES